MRKKKGKISTVLLIIMFLVGLSVMLYPIVSNWYIQSKQAKVISNYVQKVNSLNEEKQKKMLEQAREYNRQLAALQAPLEQYEQVKGYEDILDITGTGVMGYVTIPSIDVKLPIYHGTGEDVLNEAVGHMQGSTFPVGGLDTNGVISAHRGLPSATLFSDLDKITEGDLFTITVLNEVYTYEVEKILIILPHESQHLAIQKGRDLVTLTTCTPYGINTHRLVIRGHRIKNPDNKEEYEVQVKADAVQIDDMVVVPIIAAPLVALLLAWWLFGGKKKKFPHNDPLSVFDNDSGNDKTKPDK